VLGRALLYSQRHKISNIEASKLRKQIVERGSLVWVESSNLSSQKLLNPLCWPRTPLGFPVEPEV